MALYSFIQSINTTFGTLIFEPVAETIAKNNFYSVKRQYDVGENISERCQQTFKK